MNVKHDDYPNLWKRGLIQRNVRQRANHKCEQCAMEFHKGTNLAITARNKRGNPIIGTVHHIDENKSNNTKANLVYLCQCCHWSCHLLGWTPQQVIPKRWRNDIPKWVQERGLVLKLYDRQLL